MAISETKDAEGPGAGNAATAEPPPAAAVPAGPASIFLPTADEDERLRGLIRAELERQHVRPVALRTLSLIAEGGAEPIAEAPGYRIVDRRGATRLHPVPDGQEDPAGRGASAGEGAPVPLTLADLVGELRARHPELFAPPPEPVPELTPEPARDPLADVKAAGARFVGTQSALARSFAERSAERGRTLAASATGTVVGWRSGLAARLTSHPTPRPAADPGEGSVAPASWVMPVADARAAGEGKRLGGLRSRLGGLLARAPFVGTPFAGASRASAPSPVGDAVEPDRGGLRRLVDRAREGGSPADAWSGLDDRGRRRTVYLGLGTLTLAALVLAVALAPHDGRGPAPSSPARSPASPPAVTAEAPAATPTAPASDADVPPPEPDVRPTDTAPRGPGDVAGVPEVIDTATLRVSGTLVHLFGVEWVRGGQPGELSRYLAGRSVTCQPAPGSNAYLCGVDGRDLSEVVLFNGGGRASSEATPDLVAAEDHARTERLGVWKR